MFSKKLVGTLIATAGIAAAAAPAEAATFAVNTTADSGGGSLRSAMNAAEGTNRADEIVFEIPGNGVHTIALQTDLPIITKPLTIRGYSQPGADPATEEDPATPTVVIDAANALRGIDIGGDDVEVRGLVVKNAQGEGIHVEGRDNVVAGNHIGTNAAGDASRPNGGPGVQVSGQDNLVGGPEPKDRNVIAGNVGTQVQVSDGSGHVVENNRIGTNAEGKGALGGTTGLELVSSANTVRDNLISGLFHGVLITGDDNDLQGNDIGTKESGKRKLPNMVGVRLLGADGNQLGGTGEGDGNLVSGNRLAGISIEPLGPDAATGNVLEGNLVGTTFTGRAPLPNGTTFGEPGIAILGSSGNTVGGDEPGAGNVISSNEGDGVRIAGSDGNLVLGNWLGTNKTGLRDLGNGGSGVEIVDGDNNRVGDDDESHPLNLIAHNAEDGVTVRSGDENSVLRTETFDNDLSIDLGDDGPTANDPADLDGGANDLQNGPEIETATPTSVTWELETTPLASYRLEFYACDAGEGATYLGSADTLTDANGDADETTPLPTPVDVGDSVAMTATRLQLGGVIGDIRLLPRETSELSPCEEVVE
jgi:parallel beta-helix repeat protein